MASGEGIENIKVAGPSTAAVSRKRMRAATPIRAAENIALQAALQEIHQLQFLQEFQDVFFDGNITGSCGLLEHKINLSDFKPIKQFSRRIPIYLRKEITEIIQDMKRQGIIEESNSPWVSPVVLVKKKDGSKSFCIDYRKLKAVMIKVSYPLPRIEDILDQLSGNSWFSTLDLKSGYSQVKLRPGDRQKTAFFVENRLWQFTVMPFGLCQLPSNGLWRKFFKKFYLRSVLFIWIISGEDTNVSNHGIGAVLSQVQNNSEKVIAYYSRILTKTEKNYCVMHLEGQLARWMKRLQQYEFEVIHQKGHLHQNADGLSRRPCAERGCNYCNKIESRKKLLARITFKDNDLENWRKHQLEDPIISIFLQAKEEGIRPLRQEISGQDSLSKIYWSYWDSLIVKDGVLLRKWESPNLKRIIFQIIVPKKCITQILELAHDAASSGHFDINKTLDKIRIKKTRTTVLHPQSDGQVERHHRTILDYLAKFISLNQKDWDRWIPMYLLAYRSSKHEATGYSLAELYFGKDLKLLLDLLRGVPPNDGIVNSFGNYVQKFKEKLEDIHNNVRQSLNVYSLRAIRYDKKARDLHFKEDQEVWFFNSRRTKDRASKLQNDWIYFMITRDSKRKKTKRSLNTQQFCYEDCLTHGF
ncbi:uncharacterized protein [Anoplolepis gracilipes]|uniref:uncharacterized protein n=1 Tax=Anoplolepis gracilipes TaxID=354296 RepID=UPI003BA27D3E